MTSTTLQRPVSISSPADEADRKQTFSGVVKAEWIKLASLRSIRWTLVIALVSGLGMSGLVALGMASELFSRGVTAEALTVYLTTTVNLPTIFLILVFGVLGVFSISSEYASGMILSSLTAVPKRGRLFGAKLLVVTMIAAGAAVALVIGTVLIAAIVQPEVLSVLGHTVVFTSLLGSILTLVLITLFSFGVATILKSTAGSISILAGVTFVLPIAINILSATGWAWVNEVGMRIPLMLVNSLSWGAQPAFDPATQLSYGAAALTLLAWALVAVIPAAVLFGKRDAT